MTLTFDALAAKPDPSKLKPTTQKKIETLTSDITHQEKDLKHTLGQGKPLNTKRTKALYSKSDTTKRRKTQPY